jgi:hypothetical protein
MVTREVLIGKIIQQRQPFVQRIEQVEHKLKESQENLKELENLRISLIPKLDDPIVLELFKKLSLDDLQKLIDEDLRALQKLKRRFKRSTLNIGVVGRARQGKSRFLQSVSGLTRSEIPDGDREHCTGVRSTIYHKQDGSQKTHGLVYFHTQESFLEEIIKPYYEQLSLGNLPNIQDFARNSLPELPETSKKLAEYKAKYEHLKKYKDYFDKYFKFLGTTQDKPLEITKEQIREYVAQDDENGERIYFRYLAIKEVKIFCPFPQKEVGKIALIDLPGLGDTGIGDEARLVKTVGEDVDVIIFIKKPQKGDYWADVDVKLYDIAERSLIELPVNLWSYMILNYTPTLVDNYVNCQDLQKFIKQQHIDVIQSLIVDCADKDQVAGFLDTILNYLAHSINDLDRKYARSCQIRLQELEKTVNEELINVRNLLSNYANTSRQFLGLFNQFMDKLSESMRTLNEEFKEGMTKNDPEFEKQVKKALEDCKLHLHIPDEGKITQRAYSPDDKGSHQIAYLQYIAELRANISQNFHLLDCGLQDSIANFKSRVADTLISQVGLGDITTKRNADFILVMADKFAEKNNKLELGFRTFYDYEMSYGSLLLRIIRGHLNSSLSPDTNTLELKEMTPQTVKKNLQSLYDEIIKKCEVTLNNWLTVPSEVQYYMLEEFIDRILYADGMKDEWFAFLDDTEIRSLVWTEFRQIEERKRLQETWRQQVNLARIEPNSLDFMNV